MNTSASTAENDAGPARGPKPSSIIATKAIAAMPAAVAQASPRNASISAAAARPSRPPASTRRQLRSGRSGRSGRLAQIAPVNASAAARGPCASCNSAWIKAMPSATVKPLTTWAGMRWSIAASCLKARRLSDATAPSTSKGAQAQQQQAAQGEQQRQRARELQAVGQLAAQHLPGDQRQREQVGRLAAAVAGEILGRGVLQRTAHRVRAHVARRFGQAGDVHAAQVDQRARCRCGAPPTLPARSGPAPARPAADRWPAASAPRSGRRARRAPGRRGCVH